ncbi:MAG: hypothetical protein IJ079_03900 [Lachnospiraceae bacterium]|nr:hypothetical protein [Lachnospiraceae bacterium]MBR1567552.1 hypothetical protein [Lachnospiraceae bacterium]MBR1568708.1 hypothetical protein [Lachnospiraceae bacterium]
MTSEALKYIADYMSSKNIPYDFMRYKGTPPGRYWVGEYQEVENQDLESTGYQETSFYLSGFTRESYLLLEQDKADIRSDLPLTTILSSGSGIAMEYVTGRPVETNDPEIKRMDLTITIKEWRVNSNE